jgi:hypothetical protein
MPMTTEQMILMLLMAVLGGTGARFIEFLGKRKSEKLYKNDIEHSKVELRLELEKLKNQLLVSENELLVWQAKYYETLEKLAKVNYELSELLSKLHLH